MLYSMQLRPVTVLWYTSMRGSHTFPGDITGPQVLSNADHPTAITISATPLMATVYSTVVGHILVVHTCSFMCTNHIIAHIPSFLPVREHSGLVAFPTWNGTAS